MPRLQPVIWSKGTSLTQQHLQMQDLFLESSLHFRLNARQDSQSYQRRARIKITFHGS